MEPSEEPILDNSVWLLRYGWFDRLKLYANLRCFLLQLTDVQVHQELRQLRILLEQLLGFLNLHLRPDQLDTPGELLRVTAHISHCQELLLLLLLLGDAQLLSRAICGHHVHHRLAQLALRL